MPKKERKSFVAKLSQSLQLFWNENPWLGVLCIFYLGVIAFSVWVSPTSFTDPDAFYHMKVTELIMKEHGAITDFVWLPYTTLAENYVDHHLMYHVFLIPFFYLFGSIMGMKLATFLLGAATVTLFYIVLRMHKVRYAFGFSALLLFTEGFAFRMALSKAPSFSFLFLIGLFALIYKKKWVALIPLSFFYVWSYGGFSLALVVGVVYAAASLLDAWVSEKHFSLKEQWRPAITPGVMILIGILLGLLIHPSFPDHLGFYWQQLVQIGIVNYGDVIGVGGEWYPMPPLDLFAGGAQITLLVITGLIAYIKHFKKQNAYSTTALLLTVLFCFMTLKSQRYIEYYIPWAYMFAALSWHYSGWLKKIPSAVREAKKAIGGDSFQKVAAGIIIVYAVFITGVVISFNSVRTLTSLRAGIVLERYADAGEWLRNHANREDVVFHSDWDDFPILFFHVGKVRHISGLDPTFLYNANPDLHWKWSDITTGKQKDDLIHIIGRDFKARFVVIENDHTEMMENVRADGHFTEVYSDDELTIFRVPRKLPKDTRKKTSTDQENTVTTETEQAADTATE